MAYSIPETLWRHLTVAAWVSDGPAAALQGWGQVGRTAPFYRRERTAAEVFKQNIPKNSVVSLSRARRRVCALCETGQVIKRTILALLS